MDHDRSGRASESRSVSCGCVVNFWGASAQPRTIQVASVERHVRFEMFLTDSLYAKYQLLRLLPRNHEDDMGKFEFWVMLASWHSFWLRILLVFLEDLPSRVSTICSRHLARITRESVAFCASANDLLWASRRAGDGRSFACSPAMAALTNVFPTAYP